MGKLNITLTGQMVNHVQAEVRSGRYASASEYVRDALRDRMELDREQDVMRERLSSAHKQAKDGTLLSHDEVFQYLSNAMKILRALPEVEVE